MYRFTPLSVVNNETKDFLERKHTPLLDKGKSVGGQVWRGQYRLGDEESDHLLHRAPGEPFCAAGQEADEQKDKEAKDAVEAELAKNKIALQKEGTRVR